MAQEKILVVDSDPHVLELCLRSLSADGYIVEGATSGRQATEIARKEQFDLLLVDIMPCPEPCPELCRRVVEVKGCRRNA